MKKMLVILWTLCLLLTLAACGGQKGVPVVNGFDWGIAEVYVVPCEDDWGDITFGPLAAGNDAYIYLENMFETRQLVVNIRAVDDDGEAYEAYNVPIKDGDTVVLQLDENAEFAVYVNETEKYPGQWLRNTPSVYQQLTGVFEYDELSAWMLIYEDGTWAKVNYEGGVVAEGTWENGVMESLSLYAEDGSTYLDELFTVDENGHPLPYGVYRSEFDGLLEYVCGFDDAQYQDILAGAAAAAVPAYFEQMGYEVNYSFGEGGTRMENGAFMYTEDGVHGEPLATTVSMTLDSYDDTGDGYVEIEFTKVHWLDVGDFPAFAFEYTKNVTQTQNLYDYYTGYWLADSGTTNDTSRGENYFYFEYESQGRTICVDYNYSTEWERKADSSLVLTMKHFIRMPADYDGVVYAQLEAYQSYDEYLAYQEYKGEAMAPAVDPRLDNAVICRVNDI